MRTLGALALAATVVASANAQDPVGVITHQMDANSVTLLRNANVRHAKTTLYWNDWVADTAYRTAFAAGIQRLAAAKLEITVVVHAPPPGSSYDTRDQVYRAFADFMAARAAQFTTVRNWQLWNEQDAPGWTDVFGAGRVPLREQGRNYATMLNLASPRIKQANRRANVVVGGLAGPDDSTRVFLQGIYDGRGSFDVLAVHAYGPPVVTAARARGKILRDAMAAANDNRPLWLTEFGITGEVMSSLWGMSDPVDQDLRQRDEWRDVATWNDASRTYQRIVGYVLYDVSDYGYGIVRKDKVTVRPAYTWLQQRNR
ncbi:hypothetical protein rosag_25200 [Roseisolibacter agri]|uniref:Glycoside hydrolase family 5 domain-containing protein n=1 Tax=Roseisolibacter agri TaxID=2014610 RepID=A0AA37V324_9BACT|nr:hypothetical protein rosag_25200 [Roseisolibacter agri]